MKKVLFSICFLLTCGQVLADDFLEKARTSPISKLDFALFKLDLALSASVSEIRTKWGLSSGVLYETAKAIYEEDLIQIVVYGSSQAKNLNLSSCSQAITEFYDNTDIDDLLSQVWMKEVSDAELSEIQKRTAVKMVIFETTNSSLNFQCAWGINSDTVYQLK